MRFTKILCIIICLVAVFSLCACEEQGTPSADELDNGGVASTDFDPNAFKPKPAPEKLYINTLTYLETLKETELSKMPVAVVINNSADLKDVQSGISFADIVFEAEIGNGSTSLLAVYKSAPSGVNIGPLSRGEAVFAEIAIGFNWRLASNGIDAEHAEPFLASYSDYFNLSEEKFAIQIENGKGDGLKTYTDGTKLNDAVNEMGLSVDAMASPFWMFASERATILDSAKKITVKFNDTSTTEFYYNEDEKLYVRGKDGAPIKDYNTELTSGYSNVFVLKAPLQKYTSCDHIYYTLQSGEGYYATAGGWEKITWRRNSSSAPIYFEDAIGNQLEMNKGKSYVCIVNNAIDDSFKVE